MEKRKKNKPRYIALYFTAFFNYCCLINYLWKMRSPRACLRSPKKGKKIMPVLQATYSSTNYLKVVWLQDSTPAQFIVLANGWCGITKAHINERICIEIILFKFFAWFFWYLSILFEITSNRFLLVSLLFLCNRFCSKTVQPFQYWIVFEVCTYYKDSLMTNS